MVGFSLDKVWSCDLKQVVRVDVMERVVHVISSEGLLALVAPYYTYMYDYEE